MSPKKAAAPSGGPLRILPAVMGGAALLLAAGLVSFELQTQRAAMSWKGGGGPGSTGIMSDVQAAESELQRRIDAAPPPTGRNPFAIVPRPVVIRPKKVVEVPKPIPTVNALILGGQPQAIVTYNGQELTVSPGSRIDDLTVTKIDAEGVHVAGRGTEMVLRAR